MSYPDVPLNTQGPISDVYILCRSKSDIRNVAVLKVVWVLKGDAIFRKEMTFGDDRPRTRPVGRVI